MIYDENFLYSPVLRTKQGELEGANNLSSDIADVVRPRWVVAPPTERDPGKQRLLTKDEIVYGTGRRIASCWPLRNSYLDPQFLIPEFGSEGISEWLPRMFQVARDNDAKVIPIATLDELLGDAGGAFQKSIDPTSRTKFGLRVESGEIDRELASKIRAAMNVLELTQDQCSIIADFCDADFSDPVVVSTVAQGALEVLQEAGKWRHVIFQGTNYPETNPADPNSTYIVARNEWLAWKRAIQFDKNTSEHLIFGDYGADCAKFNFQSSGGGRPIRHYRYTTPDSWLVVRGVSDGKDKPAMKAVSENILGSGMYAGRPFSSADDYIFMCAKGWAGPGNPSTWRGVNTTHHITRVVSDIGRVKGMEFAAVPISELLEQPDLF
ncbi:MAG: beta family protein [Pseudomonadota bacterium]